MTTSGWQALIAGLSSAGEEITKSAEDLDSIDRADAQRALVRALNNQLGRFEIDRELPELVPFNGWREKFFLDNPDYRYWITDIRDDGEYRISGNVGDSVYQSITVYAGTNIATTTAVARVDSDLLAVNSAGDFEIMLSGNDIDGGTRLQLPPGSTSVWVRYVHEQVHPARPGECRIETLGGLPDRPPADAGRLDRDLSRLGALLTALPKLLELSVNAGINAPNTIRHWTAMAGGAAFTEPGIHYLRGSWRLSADEALLIEGPLVSCRHWNIVLYNRFLNSLDYRHHVISRTGATSTIRDGCFRFVLAARDPQLDSHDWLDTQGRGFGLFVLRFLQADTDPELPTIRCVRLADLIAPR